jgi:hypothetical protein
MWQVSHLEWSETRRRFVTIAFQLWFGLHHVCWEGGGVVQENHKELKLSGTHQSLAYADDVNIVGENRYHTENTEALLDASKEAGWLI